VASWTRRKKEIADQVDAWGKRDRFVQLRERFKLQGLDVPEAYERAFVIIRQEVEGDGGAAEVPAVDVPAGDGVAAAETAAVVGPPEPVDFTGLAEKGKAQARDVVDFVFENIGNPAVKPEDAPSMGAWAYLQHVRGSAEARKDFYRDVWARLIPKTSDEDLGAQRRQNEKVDELAGQLIDAISKRVNG
jgi:hypothetical protein